MNLGIILLRFFITFILSLMFGLERQKSHKLIGFGTFIFVAMGSCGLAIAAVVMSPENPLAFMGAIVTGIGFLGAGLIIFQDNKLRGLTTAAGLWVAAGLGLAVGYGLYLLALIVTILTLLTFTVLWYVEQYVEAKFERENRGTQTDSRRGS